MIDKKAIQNLNNAEFGKFSYDKNYEVKIEAGRQQGKSFRAGMEFSNKIWKDKIRAKIEEYKEKCKNCNFKGKICEDFTKNYNCVIAVCLNEFHSLLEKE